MKRVRKLLSIMLIFVSMFIFSGIVSAKSPGNDGYISVKTNEDEFYLYKKDSPTGASSNLSYDSNENRILLKNYEGSLSIKVYNMGDLNIKIEGNNKISNESTLLSNESNDNTNFYIDGPGSIILNNSKFIDFNSENTFTQIKNISLEAKSDLSWPSIIASNLDVDIENVNFNFALDGEYSVGIYGENVKIKDSNISGYTCNRFIGSNISLEIKDSVINYSAGLISAGNNFNLNNSKLNYNYDSNKEVYYQSEIAAILAEGNFNVTSSDIKIDNAKQIGIITNKLIADSKSNIDILNSGIGIYAKEMENNSKLNISDTLIGILGQKLNLKSNEVIIKGAIIGITTPYELSEDEEYSFNINGDLLEINITKDEEKINALKEVLNNLGHMGLNRDIWEIPSTIGFYISESDKPIIKLSDDMIMEGGKIYYSKTDYYGDPMYVHYIGTKQLTFNFDDDDDPFLELYNDAPTKLVIRNKNYNPNKNNNVNNETKKDEIVENPKTGDINIYMVGSLIIFSMALIKISTKKLKKNK